MWLAYFRLCTLGTTNQERVDAGLPPLYEPMQRVWSGWTCERIGLVFADVPDVRTWFMSYLWHQASTARAVNTCPHTKTLQALVHRTLEKYMMPHVTRPSDRQLWGQLLAKQAPGRTLYNYRWEGSSPRRPAEEQPDRGPSRDTRRHATLAAARRKQHAETQQIISRSYRVHNNARRKTLRGLLEQFSRGRHARKEAAREGKEDDSDDDSDAGSAPLGDVPDWMQPGV